MVNKDYILRLIERFSRALARIIFLRQANRHQDALIFIDELFRQTLGLNMDFVNSASEEMLMALIAPMGTLNVEKCLWIALLLKAEGDTYNEMEKHDEAYARHLKSLNLLFEVLLREKDIRQTDYFVETEELLKALDAYELPLKTKSRLVLYYEKTGRYAKAEDLLFEIAEANPSNDEVFGQGEAFYARLKEKSAAELAAGDFSREEIEEGWTQLMALRDARV